MYLENGDEVIEADNGRLILANSGAYCDEDGNPTGGCIDDEEYVFVTKSGKSYHIDLNCRTLKNHEFTKIPKSQIGDRKPCKRCHK